MLPSTAYLLSDAFRQSLQFSTVTPASPQTPVQHATIDHNTLDHAQLAHAVKTGGPHQFPESELPKIGMRLRRSGQFSAADVIDNHAKAIQAAKQSPAAPVATRPNLPAYAGVLSPNRKKAVMDFVNHSNPDVQKHVADHQVHVPGLTPKEAYVRAQNAYDTFHASHMGVPMATAPVPVSAPQPKQKPSRTGLDQSEIARRMGLTPGPHPPEPSMDWKKSDAPLPMPQAPAPTPVDSAPAPQQLATSPRPAPLRPAKSRAELDEIDRRNPPRNTLPDPVEQHNRLEYAAQQYKAGMQKPAAQAGIPQDAIKLRQQMGLEAAPVAKQAPADVAKMHAEAVRSGRPVPPQHLERVAKNLRAHGYHAEADQIAPKQDDATYAADQFGSGTIPATTGITGAGLKRPGSPAPQRSFLNDESTGAPAKLNVRPGGIFTDEDMAAATRFTSGKDGRLHPQPSRPAPANTPAEQLPAPKFGPSTHLQGKSGYLPENHPKRRQAVESWMNSDAGSKYLDDAGHAGDIVHTPVANKLYDQFHGQGQPEESQPSTHGRFSRLLDAARQGKLKEHVEGGLGRFFDKFDEHGSRFLNGLGLGEIAAPSSASPSLAAQPAPAARRRQPVSGTTAQQVKPPESPQPQQKSTLAKVGNFFARNQPMDVAANLIGKSRFAKTGPEAAASHAKAIGQGLQIPAQHAQSVAKNLRDHGYHDSADKLESEHKFSRAIANLNDIVQEFARRSAPNQMSLFGGDEIALATAPKSKTRSLRKPAPGQKSFNWDEDSHPREKDQHDGKRPGEFAPKESGDKPAEKPVMGNPITENSSEKSDNRTYSAKGNEVHDADGVRHGAFRNEDKAKEAAERWNREGKPNSTPAAKAVEAKFPSLAGYVEPESPREELKRIADEHLASEIPPAQNPVSGPKADAKKEPASTDDQPNYANLPADDGSDPDAPKSDDDEYGPVKDFGEKIGGARKDRAVERGSSAKKEKSSQPAWMKRYIIAPVATGENVGKFTIIDAKNGRAALRGVYLDSREQAEAILPDVEVKRKHDVRNVAKQGEPDNWAVIRHVNDRKRPVIKGGFKTSAEATAYMVDHAAEILATNTRITNSIHPAMENVTRKGPTHRPNGKHATEGDFEKFGFRGVEFGKWVNQAEGRHILDHAYDSLVDMAEAIGVPAKALSLDGELGLGFGSRGHGNAGWGGAANAHYERHYGAINITKLHGAGSLAHEWMHAVDHWLGRKSGKTSDQKILNKYNDEVFKTGEPDDDFVSHGAPRRPKEGFRAEVAAAIEGVRDAITSRDVKYKEDQSTHEKIQKRRTEELSKQLAEFRSAMARDYSKDKYQHYKGKRGLPASPEVMKEIDEISAKLLAGDYGANVQHGESSPDTPANKANWGHTMPAHVARLADLHKQLRGNKGYSATKGYGGTSIHGIIADVKTAAMMHRTGLANLKEAKEQKEKTGKVRSEFYSHAGAMDQGQDGDYWSTPHEMMARAFEAYVYDKLKAKKGHNDFLAYEKHNDLPEYRMFNVKPYPEGDERPKINAAFDHLFSVLSKHEMDGTHRSTVKKVDKEAADTKTWRGYLKATDTAHWISGIESHIKGRDGIVRFAEKKGSPTKSQFFSKPAGTSMEDWEKKIKSENKSGKFFVITNGEQQFSRASSLETALSRLTALSSSLRNAS